MWQKIDMRNRNYGGVGYNPEIMCRHAVDRSQGGLVEIDIWHFDSLLNYIADSSSNLRSLRVAVSSSTTTDGLTEAIVKLPLLEELEVSYCLFSGEALEVVGQACPNLKTLKLNQLRLRRLPIFVRDDFALAIAETMPRLRHLQLFGNKLTEAGLKAILDNCLDLEHLDLRMCVYLNLSGDLKKRCCERVKVLRKPFDSTRDYIYNDAVILEETCRLLASDISDYSDFD